MNNTRFPIIEYADASPELREIYDDIRAVLGTQTISNWLKCQGGNPRILQGNWLKVKDTLLRGCIPRLLKELIIYNISKERNCKSCSFVHKLSADQLGEVGDLSFGKIFKITESLENDLIPSSYRSAIRIATKCALNPLSTSTEDFDELRDEGYSDAEIHELMAQADLAIVLNTIADISGIEIDKEFLRAIDKA